MSNKQTDSLLGILLSGSGSSIENAITLVVMAVFLFCASIGGLYFGVQYWATHLENPAQALTISALLNMILVIIAIVAFKFGQSKAGTYVQGHQQGGNDSVKILGTMASAMRNARQPAPPQLVQDGYLPALPQPDVVSSPMYLTDGSK